MLNISFDGKFIFCGDKVLSTQTNELVENVDTHFWLSFLKENSIFCFENNAGDFGKLNKLLREVSYALSDKMQRLNGYDFIYEFEKKFVPKLISESYESVNFVKNLSNAWDFIIEKYENFGFVNEQKDASSFDQWIQTKGKDFIESLRNKLFSALGVGLQTFLSFTGFGQIAVTTVWGVLLAYDVYMQINGSNNWVNIIIDLLSFLPGASGLVSKIFRGSGKAIQSAGSLEGALTNISQSPYGAKFVKLLGSFSGWASKILNHVKEGILWLSKKFGLTYLYQITGKLFSFINGTLNKISAWRKVMGAKWGSAENVGQALASSAKSAGITAGVMGGLNVLLPKEKVKQPTYDVAMTQQDKKLLDILNTL